MHRNIQKGFENKSGIYRIIDPSSGRFYIGSAKNFRKRFNAHLTSFRNKNPSIKLLNFVQKYGHETLIFEIVEFCDEEFLIEREQEYLDYTFVLYDNDFHLNTARFSTSPDFPESYEKLKGIYSPAYGRKTKDSSKKILSQKIGRRVAQKTLNNVLIKEYNSIFEAAEQTGKTASEIKRIAYKIKLPYDFIWELLGKPAKRSKVTNIAQFDKNGKFLKKYNDLAEAANSVGGVTSTIHTALKTKGRLYFGFYWKVCEEDIPPNLTDNEMNVPNKIHSNSKKVLQKSIKDRKIIASFLSPRDASNKTELPYTAIRRACAAAKYKNAYGFRWEYVV